MEGKKINNNISKSSRDIHPQMEETKANDYDYHHYGEDHQFDEETETMLRNLNIDSISENPNIHINVNVNNKNNNNEIKNNSNNNDNEVNITNNNHDHIITNNEGIKQDINNDNNHEQSKLKNKKNQLSPFAPEFNVSTSPSINPYSGDFSIQTQPVYVPPAQIPSKSQRQHHSIITPVIASSNLVSNQRTDHSSNAYHNGTVTTTQHNNNNNSHIRNGVNNNVNNDNNQQSSSTSLKPPHHNTSELLRVPNTNYANQQLSPNILPQSQHGLTSTTSPYFAHKTISDDISNGSDKSNEDHHVHLGIDPNHNDMNNNDTNSPSTHLHPYIGPTSNDYVQGKTQVTNSFQHQSNKKHYQVEDPWKQPYRESSSKDRYPMQPNQPTNNQIPLNQTHMTMQGTSRIPTTQPQHQVHSNIPIQTPITTLPTQQITTSLQGATPIGPTQPYKINARNFGPPPLDAIDPKFTNPEDIRQFQKWELLESAKRWLPGEGTFITWKGYRYLIGGPIHMGMNGHIHYCYKYAIPPIDDNKSSKDSNNDKDKNKDNTSEIDANGHIKLPPKVETVAAKIVPNTPAFAREIYILRALQGCENITELYDVLESERTLISILELAQADVFNFFVGRVAIRHGWNLDKPAIREHFARMVISNVVQGLDQMHKKNYLHCDLKSLNILLYIYSTGHSQRRGGVYIKGKLTDFGHSSHGQIRTAEKLFSNGMARVGTAGHVAPELFVENAPCGPKIDIWSLGIVMFSMLVPGRLLFGEYTNLDALKKAYDRLYKNPFSRDTPSWWSDFERLSPEARDLILWMTRYDEKERPNEQQILAHPWFQIANSSSNKSGPYRPKLQWADMLSSSIAQE